ncbi:uncharacterized protein LOC129582943, partial [Paramacrobiotus metropolitanus]|uniref:uncharacterized protein LOC129582943 n=1 Tax=Paramacrobiotus metropolitanus TaxID=2943436 RepID=UPI002445C2AA
GVKDVLSYYDGNDRELITVLAGGNAAGEILRPLILFDGKVVLASHFNETNDMCHIGFNSSGIMDNATFASYVREEVIPRMTAEKNVIFLDGHSSHINKYTLLRLPITLCIISVALLQPNQHIWYRTASR